MSGIEIDTQKLWQLTKLKILYMFDCDALEEFFLCVSIILALEDLNFVTCQALKTIPESFGNLTKLKILHIFECEALEEFLLGIGNLLR